MIRDGGFALPAGCDRVVIDFATSSVEAVLDHRDAPNDEWAFGVSRLEIALGSGAWAYFDGFGRLRRLRVHLEAPLGWIYRLKAINECNADEVFVAEQVARVAATFEPSRAAAAPANSSSMRPAASIAGCVALVTGASRGIGAAIAQRLAAAGAFVAVTARTLEGHPAQTDEAIDTALADTIRSIRARGGVVEPLLADLADPSAPESIVARVSELFGPIDILVNNAARGIYLPVERWTTSAVARVFQVNALSPFALCRLVIPEMKQRRTGAIVNVSSIVAERPIGPPYGLFERKSFTTVYGMAKAALDRMSSGLAIECCEHNVRINSISPSGGARTPGALAASKMFNRYPHYAEPLETISEAVLALCEPIEPMITGRVLTSGSLLADLRRPVRGLDGGAFDDHYAVVDLREPLGDGVYGAGRVAADLRRR
ncbi:MAG TPA: SDR family oxidoreductase [Acidimicrobiales bacterium]|nr:SDR family oxidoreductase [Acidimicrobiales bacterium]